jgi:hypothetical protein
MMMKRLVVLSLLLGGCSLYWGDDNADDVCNAPLVPANGLRDPSTGQCGYIGGGGNCGCYQCPETTGVDIAEPDWASCPGKCDALDEQTCLQTAGCHAAYTEDVKAGSGPTPTFWGCWDVPPSGPIEGSCSGLDAQTCSEHDDCIAIYLQGLDPGPNGETTAFSSCQPEQAGACSGVDCGAGSHCEQQCAVCDPPGPCNGPICQTMCVPDVTCNAVDCGPGYTCAEQCDASNGLVGTCSAVCVPTDHDPGQCYGTVSCNSAPPACPANDTPGVANGCYTGYCIPVTDCGPHDPGKCYVDTLCDIAAPACPSGTLPGIGSNNCYTGYCIPTSQCEVPACETLTTEQACTARNDCAPVYSGSDCTCTGSGCTCQTLTYERCESLLMPI